MSLGSPWCALGCGFLLGCIMLGVVALFALIVEEEHAERVKEQEVIKEWTMLWQDALMNAKKNRSSCY